MIWLASFALLVGMPVSHDLVWQLWIARHLNAGVGLYSWIMEVNPPLWYWMAQPIDLLAGLTGVRATTLLVASMFCQMAISLALAAALVREWPPIQRAALLAGMLVASLCISVYEFGQREQQALLALIPYTLLLARRVEGKSTGWALTLGVAVMAAPMIALKHYFIVAPVLLELWLVWCLRRQWRPLRIETLVLALGAVSYGAAVLVFTPQYLTDMVPVLKLAYGGMQMEPLYIVMNWMTVSLMLGALYLWHFRRELSPAAQAVVLLTAAFAIAYFLQFKGWGYHKDPVTACLFLALLLHISQRPTQPRLRWSEAVAAGAILVTTLVLNPVVGSYQNPYSSVINELLDDAEPGMTAMMMTSKATRIWPMVDLKGLKWPSRYYHFWMMPSVANGLASGKPLEPQLADFAARVRLQTVDDLVCNPPDILIADAASVDSNSMAEFHAFDMLAFFEEEPKFAALMESYAAYAKAGPFTAYHRVAPLPAPSGPCVALVTAR